MTTLSALEELRQLLAPDQFSTQPKELQHYGKDWTTYFDIKASAVVFPKSTQDIQTVVLWANRHQVAIVPSGGRTGLSGGACATNGEIILSLQKMNQILDFSSLEHTVQVQAGVITQDLQNWALEKGLFYPVDFAARGSSQIGGNIATNAGGIKVLRYGLTRDWIAGLVVVTGSGEILNLNQGLIKNATGYDLRHLIVGSEGTLAIVAEATIRLALKPPPLQVFFIASPSLPQLMEAFAGFRQRLTLTAFEMLSERALEIVTQKLQVTSPLASTSPYYAVVEFEVNQPSDAELALETFSDLVDKGALTDGALAQSETQAKMFWRLREDISESLSAFSPYKNDLSVRVSKVPALVLELNPLLKARYPTWEVVWFGHVGDGNLHINILRPNGVTKEDFVRQCQSVDELLFAVVQKHHGSISAEHGVGLTKKKFLHFTRSESEIELFSMIKKTFDPKGVLNPGKLIPDSPD